MSDYVISFIKSTLSDNAIILPDKSQLNGYGSRPEVWEAVVSLTDAHKLGGASAAKQSWESVIAKTIPDIAELVNRKSRIIHASELKNQPRMQWLIDGEIPARAITVVFGAPEAGKSFLVLDYAERVGQRKPVLYIAAEGESGYYQRHEAWMKFHKAKETNLHFIQEAVFLLQKGETERLIEEAEGIKPSMVVFDTFSQCFVGGEENNASDVSRFIVEARKVVKALSCAVILIHHISKGGGERGSSALRGNVDMMIEVDNDDDVIRVIPSKDKDHKKRDPRRLKRVEVDIEPGITSCVLIEAQFVKEQPDELNANQKLIIEVLSSVSYDQGARSTDLQRATNINGTTYYRTVESLAKRGLIKKQGKFDPWFLTTKGWEMARKSGFAKVA